MRPPIIIGGYSLWQHGWTMQQHQLREIAYPMGAIIHYQAGERYFTRSAAELDIFEAVSDPLGDCLLAPPAYALADMILHRDGELWWPGASDLEEDEIEDNRAEIIKALKAFGGHEQMLDDALAEEGFPRP